MSRAHDFNSVDKVSRRGFLAASVGAGLAASRLGQAAEPIVRNGKSHLKLALAGYSFNGRLPRNWPTPQRSRASMTLFDFIDFCAAQNLDGTELTSYYFPAEVTSEYLNEIKERTFRLGLDISGTAIGNDFCVPEGPQRERELALCRQWIDYAAEMGAPVIRIFAGETPRGDTEAAAVDRCVTAIDEVLDYAGQKGVVLALENHHGVVDTADQLLAIVKRVKASPWFGVNFDSGNFLTEDPYSDMQKVAPYAVNAQIKVSTRPNGGPKQPTDFRRVISILKDSGYRGYVVLEYEEQEDPFTAIPRYLDVLRELLG